MANLAHPPFGPDRYHSAHGRLYRGAGTWDGLSLPVIRGPVAFDITPGTRDTGPKPSQRGKPSECRAYLNDGSHRLLLEGPQVYCAHGFLVWVDDVCAANQGWTPED